MMSLHAALLLITTKCQISVRFISCKQAVTAFINVENKTEHFIAALF